MKKIVFITLLFCTASLLSFANEGISSPSPRIDSDPQLESIEKDLNNKLPLAREKEKTLSPRMKRRLDKVKKIWDKKEEKIKQKLAKKGIKDVDDVTFEDVVVLAGAIVVVLGIISIIFSPISAIVSVVLGLAVYLIGKGYGGSLDAFF